MKKLLAVMAISGMMMACNNEAENKTDNQKSEASEASDTTNMVDKAQEKMNEAIDTMQSKGGKLIEAAGDTLKNKVIEPVKNEAKKVGDKIKESIKETKEQVKQ